jgi:hypothetical protein
MKALKDFSAGLVALGTLLVFGGGAAVTAASLAIAIVCGSVGLAGMAWQFMCAHI